MASVTGCGTVLYHYYERARGPFRTVSDLSDTDAESILNALRCDPTVFASRRQPEYLARRRELETLARDLFIAKGGRPVRRAPHYMVIGPCAWLESWYHDGASVQIPLSDFDPLALSFTYGDLFPTFSPRVTDAREYRGTIYTKDEILGLIERYGLPQDWNADGAHGPERYIEVQVWDDTTIREHAPAIRHSSPI